MKIALFVNSAKTFFWHRKSLADKLMAEGHEVIVVCSKDGDVSRFENEKYKTYLINMSRKGKNPFKEIILIWEVYKTFKEVKPDVCHNFTIKCVIYGSLIQKIIGVKKIINSITGLGIVFVNGGLLQRLVEKFYKLSLTSSGSKVIFQNPDDQQLFLNKKLVDKDKAYLIFGSGVDIDKFKPSIRDNKITIVFASRLLKSKGILDLLKVSVDLIKSGVDHQLLVAGEPDSMSSDSISDMQIAEFQKYEHIKFLGNVISIHEIINKSHIACFPSYYREGVPKFLLESAAAGLAIVTTDMPGCREVVSNNGILIPPKDEEALLRGLSSLILNPLQIEEFGSKSREIAVSKFAESIILTQITSLYKF